LKGIDRDFSSITLGYEVFYHLLKNISPPKGFEEAIGYERKS